MDNSQDAEGLIIWTCIRTCMFRCYSKRILITALYQRLFSYRLLILDWLDVKSSVPEAYHYSFAQVGEYILLRWSNASNSNHEQFTLIWKITLRSSNVFGQPFIFVGELRWISRSTSCSSRKILLFKSFLFSFNNFNNLATTMHSTSQCSLRLKLFSLSHYEREWNKIKPSDDERNNSRNPPLSIRLNNCRVAINTFPRQLTRN